MRFFIPFSIELSRLHIFAGAATGILILAHIIERLRLLKLKFKPRVGSKKWLLPVSTLLACAAFWLAAWFGLPGISHLMRFSYEQRNHAAIFRSQGNVAHMENDAFHRTVKLSSTGASVDLELLWKSSPKGAAVAIWAETKSGSIIETWRPHVSHGIIRETEAFKWHSLIVHVDVFIFI